MATLAGNGNWGYVDGPGASAEFKGPSGIAVDSAGTVYIADTFNNAIRKISPDGLVTTLAGSGTYGFLDGPGATAEFDGPYGIAVDNTGTVYVADTFNNAIRKISPEGLVTTLAGSESAGYLDGPGTQAEFNGPYGIAVDSAGVIYVADSGNNMIRKISPDGLVTTLAGDGSWGYVDGPGATAEFEAPYGIAVNSAGTIYIADGSNIIRKISPDRIVTTLAGSETIGYWDSTGTQAEFNGPYGIAVDSTGTVYVADTFNARIRIIR